MAIDAALVVGVTVAVSSWAFFWPTTSQDEFSLLIYPDLINHGRIPNRDFFTPYGPGTYWPLAAVYALCGGPSVVSVRLAGMLYHVALALGVMAATRRMGRPASVAAGALSGLLTAGLLLIPYGWISATACSLGALASFDRKRWAVAGGLSAAAVTIRPEFVVVIVALAAIRLPARTAAKLFVVGFVVGAVPLLLHLAVAGNALITNVFVDRIGVDTRLPLLPQSRGLFLGLLALVVAVAALCVRAVLVRQRLEIGLAVLGVLLLPQTLQRLDRDHVLFVAAVVLPLAAAVLLGRELRPYVEGFGPDLVYRWVAAMCLGLIPLGAALTVLMPRGHYTSINGRTLFTADLSIARNLTQTVRVVSTDIPDSGTIFVGSVDMSLPAVTSTYLYYLLPAAVPDAYYLELAPGVAERRDSRLPRDLDSANLLVLSEFSTDRRRTLFPYLSRGSSAADSKVRENFCFAGRVTEYGPFPALRLYRPCPG